MKKVFLILILAFLFVQIPTLTLYASSSVNIVNNGKSSAKVSIQNSFNPSTSQSTGNKSSTKVRIETNGEVREYESSNGEDIHVESYDGSAKVDITDNSESTASIVSPTPPEELREATAAAQKRINEQQNSFFEKIKELLSQFFTNLF